jgi:hypothetical protein
MPAKMNTAPKMLARATVFMLGWKIWGIELSASLPLPLGHRLSVSCAHQRGFQGGGCGRANAVPPTTVVVEGEQPPIADLAVGRCALKESGASMR